MTAPVDLLITISGSTTICIGSMVLSFIFLNRDSAEIIPIFLIGCLTVVRFIKPKELKARSSNPAIDISSGIFILCL